MKGDRGVRDLAVAVGLISMRSFLRVTTAVTHVFSAIASKALKLFPELGKHLV